MVAVVDDFALPSRLTVFPRRPDAGGLGGEAVGEARAAWGGGVGADAVEEGALGGDGEEDEAHREGRRAGPRVGVCGVSAWENRLSHLRLCGIPGLKGRRWGEGPNARGGVRARTGRDDDEELAMVWS